MRKRWCIGKITGEYLSRMEDIPDLYEEPYDPGRPVLCIDERPCQLIGEVVAPIPMELGKPKRVDHEYKRNGTCSVFIACEPLTGPALMKIKAWEEEHNQQKIMIQWRFTTNHARDKLERHYKAVKN